MSRRTVSVTRSVFVLESIGCLRLPFNLIASNVFSVSLLLIFLLMKTWFVGHAKVIYLCDGATACRRNRWLGLLTLRLEYTAVIVAFSCTYVCSCVQSYSEFSNTSFRTESLAANFRKKSINAYVEISNFGPVNRLG